jgi:type 1 glutamine amidotransferase/HEAT repeat protein
MHKPTLLGTALIACLVTASAIAAEPAEDFTPEKAWRDLPAYTYDQPRRLLRFLEAEIQHAAGDEGRATGVADRLAAVLENPKATLDAKRFVCRWLSLVADESHVPVLARLLGKEETFEIARQALAETPGEASGKVLRNALAGARGEKAVGLMNALGARRDAVSVGLIAKHLDAKDAGVAAAAADALGNIGSTEAADVLAAAAKSAEGDRADRIHDARLRCARRLVDAGRRQEALAITREIFAADLPTRRRIAAIMGMVHYSDEAGWEAVRTALDDSDPRVRAAAIQAARRIEARSVTEGLTERLPTLAVRDQILLLDVLADRGDAAARPGVLKLVDATEAEVRAAVVRALGALGTAEDVPRLLDLAATGEGAVQGAARDSLARLAAEGAGTRVLDAAAKAEGAVRLAALCAVADRRTPGASDVLLKAAGEADASVRTAALEALAVVGAPADYPALVGLLAKADDARTAKAAHAAAVAVARRMDESAARLAPIRKALDGASPAAKARLLALLPALGDAKGLDLLRPYLDADAAAVRDAAVRALVAWPDAAAADAVLKVAKESENRTHRVLALRAAMRMMKETPDAAARQRLMERVRPLVATPDAKKMLLASLSEVAEPWALAAAESFLGDAAVKAEAQAAVNKIKAAGQRARRGGGAPVPEADPKAVAARKKELAKQAPEGFHLACYMDCGPQTTAGEQDGPRLRVTAGAPYFWGGADRTADVRYGTIVFTGQEVAIEAAGLDPRRAYRFGFSWWDYDHDTRAQSVWAAPAGRGQAVRLLAKADLPSGARGEKPGEKVVPLPRTVTAAKTVRLAFRNESQPNAVVSEVWLLESDATSDPPAEPYTAWGDGSQTEAKPAAAGTTKPATVEPSPRKAPVRVLLVTGVDHPGHPWRQTTPVLRQAIERDERLAVDVVSDPAWLETGDLAPYKALVHHWMDWKVPPPGEAARENLARFVRAGGGLVLVHFACGAWQDWPEFVKVAGRVWDPKLRAHDPRGPFTVNVVDADHPITCGLPASFETTDELYTCLAGETPVHLLAKATSKVDHKEYPMAFVLTCGKGRVFHCVLGHDTKALEPEPVRALYRRGTAWTAGLEPKP